MVVVKLFHDSWPLRGLAEKPPTEVVVVVVVVAVVHVWISTSASS
jgi:hypothetical protein